ncbi:MAG: DUF4118 domain-containing protein [Sphingomicrobium sp.]
MPMPRYDHATTGFGLLGYALGLLFVAGSILIGLVLAPRWGSSAVDLLFLPAVLATAVLAGLRPALLAALTSALSYNYFFTAPRLTFRIHSPNDVVTMVVLFAVAVVVSQLAASIRTQARLAQSHAARNATIAGLARQLLSCTSEQEIAAIVTRELASIFGCNTLLLSGRPEPVIRASTPPCQLAPNDIAVAAHVLESGKASGRGIARTVLTEWQFHPVASANEVLAAIGLAHDNGVPPVRPDQMQLLENLLDQVALALERSRLEADAREFERVRERDRLRSALLASIGEELQPSVAAISGAADELRRGDDAEDRPLASSIRSEAAKLQRYLANMITLGMDRSEGPLRFGDVELDLFQRSVALHGEPVHLTPKEFALFAELAKHPGRVLTHAHLIRTVWGPAQEGQTEYLRVAIRALRQKLELNAAEPRLIVNEPAVGYKLAVG